MPDRSELEALLGRVENADGPDYPLDRDLHELVRVTLDPVNRNLVWIGALTASTDAALRFMERMLPGWWWTVGDCALTHDASIAPAGASAMGLGHALHTLVGPDFRTTAGASILAQFPVLDEGIHVARVTGNIPLAIIEATLRALIALESHPAEPLKHMPA